jgi:hypothetical protein
MMPDTPMEFFDRQPIPAGVKRDGAGNLVAPDATVARTGIYDYAGYEVGRPEMRRARIYRPPEEVFSRETMRSLAAIPVTIDHPNELVDTKNWNKFAKGETSDDDIVRDGEAVRVPFILRDETAIRQVEDGKHELSPGYTAVIDWTAGQIDGGGEYDGVVRSIRYNHLAIVDRARGGSQCRIGDEELEEDDVPGETKAMLVDGFQVQVTDQAEAAITKLLAQRTELTDRAEKAETDLAAATEAKGKVEGENAVLKQQVKDATDPAALQKAASERAALCDKAKAIVPAIKLDGKTDAEIRKEVVQSKLGDAAKDMDDAQIQGAFATLSATVKPSKSGDAIIDTMRETHLADGETLDGLIEARDKANAARLKRYETASRTKIKE